MRPARTLFAIVALCLPLAGGACSSTPSTPAEAPAPGSGMTAAEMEAIFRARQDSARTRFTEADVRFMNAMIHHHAQALELARLVPERTTTQSIRTLAARIINAQQDEIASMQAWLRNRGQPVPELHITDDGVMVHGAGHHAGAMADMPGMLSAEQIAQLERLRGEEFDRMFLRLMIQHHRGAAAMVDTLVATDGALQDEDAFRLAADIQVDQVTEIARMERMLEAMTGSAP